VSQFDVEAALRRHLARLTLRAALGDPTAAYSNSAQDMK
jgi:hypothetical protein